MSECAVAGRGKQRSSSCLRRESPEDGDLRSYPLVLVRLSRVEPEALHDLLSVSWRMTIAKARRRRPSLSERSLVFSLVALSNPALASRLVPSGRPTVRVKGRTHLLEFF